MQVDRELDSKCFMWEILPEVFFVKFIAVSLLFLFLDLACAQKQPYLIEHLTEVFRV